jgi:hypothetical protein
LLADKGRQTNEWVLLNNIQKKATTKRENNGKQGKKEEKN